MRRRRPVAGTAITLVTFVLGVTLAVIVTGSASASSPVPTTTTSTTSTSSGTTTPSSGSGLDSGLDPNSPGAGFFVINGTANAASDHEIVASSAFPNYTTGAVDNYYSMAHTHVDNSPFAEGLASPADTGPIGQTAAAGNFQQSQYADARWPGGPDTATFGSQGGPYAATAAGNFLSMAHAEEPSNGLAGPGLKMPKGFNIKLADALAAWKAKWLDKLLGKNATPTVKTPKPKTGSTPSVPVPTPKPPKVSTPSATVPSPLGAVTTPAVGGASTPTPAPPAAPATPSLPSAIAAGPPRSMSSASGDGETLLSSSTQTGLVPETGSGIPEITTTKTDPTKSSAKPPYTLVTSGESSLGRVTLGGGQIRIEGIHVSAAIANDGATATPTYKAAISLGSASIGGIPVTIDESGVHVDGQGQGLPYQQASDALNSALKQAGIELFLVAPQLTTSSCGSGGGSGTGTDTTSTTTTDSTSTDQSGMTSSCGSCGGSAGSSGTGTGTTSTTTTSTSTGQTDTTSAPSSCDQSGAGAGCAPSGSSTGGGSPIGGIGTTPGTTTSTTTTTSTDQTSTDQSSTPSWCNLSGASPTASSCPTTGTATNTTTTTSTDQTTTDSTGSGDLGMNGTGSPGAGEETLTATGLHIVFTQPVSPSGVPAQYVEHILGEVYVDSLATPAPPVTSLGLSSSSSLSSCGGKGHSLGKTKSGGGTSAAGGSSGSGGGSGTSLGGSSGSAAGSPTASALGASSQPGSGSSLTSGSTPGSGGGGTLPAMFASVLKKPLWLLLAYLVWQAIVIGTGASLYRWRKGGVT